MVAFNEKQYVSLESSYQLLLEAFFPLVMIPFFDT